MITGVGLLASDQTGDLGQQRPPQGGIQSCRHLARHRKKSRRERSIPLLVSAAVGSLPHLGWRG